MYVFILILIIILLVLFLYYRTKKYNDFLTNLSREHFSSNIKKKVNIKKTLPSNPNIVFCDFEGNTFFIKDNKVWKTNYKSEIILDNENINNVFKLPYSTKIKTGTLNYKNLVLITYDNLVIEYDIIENEIISSTPINKYFKNLNNKIECIMFYKDLYYIFENNNIIIYNKNLDNIQGTKESNVIFKNIPNNITCAFLNNNIVLENVEHGIPCFFKNKDLYFYDEIKKNTFNIDTNYGFMNNTKYFILEFVNQKITFTPPKKGLYRVITIGAGNENGGYGGLVYNDYNLLKKDVLSIIIGSTGERLPLKDKIITHDKLPYTSSSAGSGGTFVYKNDKLLQCSGGGGGWSSEIIKAPLIANSYLSTRTKKNNIVIPIKKLVLTTKNNNYHNNSNIRQKLSIKQFEIDIHNYTQIDYNVITHPKINDVKHLYETDYNDYGKTSTITITFSKVISDYELKLDAHVLSTEHDKNFFDLLIYDEQNRVTRINDFNKHYNNTTFNSKTIINHFVKYPKTSFNEKVKSGNKSSKKLEDLFDSNKNTDKESPENSELHIVKLDGGIGGGGDSFFNKKIKNISCGGGGGYKGGCKISLSDEFERETEKYLNLDYISGCGGQSYITNNKFDEKCFINDYSNSNGKVIIIQVQKMQSFTNDKDTKTSTKYLQEPEKFIKPVYEPIFEKRMDKVKFNKTKFKITRPSINNDIRFDTVNYKISTLNNRLKKGVNYFKFKINSNNFDRNKIFVKCEKNVDVMCLYFSIETLERILVKNNNVKRDNILKLNHGMLDPSLVNIFTFLEKLIENNIYKYINSTNISTITKSSTKDNTAIENLFDNRDLVYENLKFLYLENDIKKLRSVDYLYVLVKSDNICNLKCNLIEYNSSRNNLTEHELKNQIMNI